MMIDTCSNRVLVSFIVAFLLYIPTVLLPNAGVTILLSLTVFSLMIYDTLPESSDAVPVLG